VYGALAAHGFGKEDLDEGWQLLRNASGTILEVPEVVPFKSDVYDRLDELENKWFPITLGTLQRRHPAVAQRVFLNLRQTSGVEVSVSVTTFVKRVRDLERSKVAEDRNAFALLQRRGLTEAVIGQMEQLLAQLEEAPEPAPLVKPDSVDIAASEQQMWGWYLEWSVIARQAIHDKRLLRALGFLAANGSVVSDDTPTEEEQVDSDIDTEPEAAAEAAQ
jgi:hypothetical protein